MRFDWKDLALWCFCSFYFGLVFGPIFFLDADALKWASICGAFVAAGAGLASFALNSSTHRLQVYLADQADFRRQWQLFGKAQLIRLDLQNAIDGMQKLSDRIEKGDANTKANFVLLDHKGANVALEEDPLIHRIIDTIWQGFQAYGHIGRDPLTRDMPIDEVDTQDLTKRMEALRQAKELIRTNIIEVLLPYFTGRGWEFAVDDADQYRVTKKGH
ncbi:hypothetical protein GFK91_24515 [Roseibium aggregatum]|uniref:hypothetical protein n=1 Tax=Roseibium aggregatum TaxID=187304 RepID=UPI001E649E1A|nr:hypothetical protein [Roseibium aggregatum]UES58512.1 hypothetical protein GFK91_24515 [Roseibium aggregatum]